ncbi:PAS domain-containing sensor histidine kinase [Massilia sp. Root418]|jgi:PAS domain S-box-containing protein|uniref:hybrid sensor histidine kinase/response regulator n=1 Tax=Massilia sp. Root418 TaxID=1736532 RepID=UPI0006FD28B7|nr:PAS domain-containing sensor histidine kinase [Massilia sp. Root418]KQW96646.1 PAS domain-containing sensor histidine kinase [Massilia sp. Root418]
MSVNSPGPASAVEAERLRLFISSVTDYAIYTLSPEGIVTSWNAGAERFKGYREEEILGQHFSRFYTEEDRAAHRPARALAVARDVGRFEDEGWRVRKDGTRFWASVVLDPIRDQDGVLLGYAKITRDITARRKEQEALHASEERFRLLVQGVTDYAIYMLSPEGLVTNWNEGARRIKGYDSDDVVGTHFERFYTEDDRAAGLPMYALATARREGRFEREGWRVRKDGSRFWAHVVIDPITDSMGELIGYAKITRDVTERRTAEEALARTKEALFQSQKLESIGQLTGGIAHDFNNLLNVISNGLDILRSTGDRALQLKTIDSMARAASRGATLTQQLLTFARRQPFTPERVRVNRIIDSFEAVLRRAVKSTMRLEFDLAPGLPEIMADVPQLESAILNLVVNARDAIGDSGAIVISSSLVTLPDAGEHVCLSVRDNGCGMTPDVASRAVEPFFTTKEVGKGTGLGLSQVYGAVQQAKGELRIVSQPGQGTDIMLLFPTLSGAGSADNEAHGGPAEKVLVVDDQADVLDITAQLFTSLGYAVLSANNGSEALDILHRTPDLSILFSDVMMPGMTGLELAKSARALRPDLKIILSSGYLASILSEQKDEIGQFDFVAKPFRLSDIIKKLR